MNHCDVLAVWDRERRELEVSGFRRIATPDLVLHVPLARPASAGMNAGFVSYSRHSPEEIEAVIDQVIATFGELGCGFEWKVFEHDLPGDLVARLARRGLRIGEAEELLVIPVADAAELIDSRHVHRVERIAEPDRLADYLAVADAVWTEKHAHAEWVREQLRDHPDQISIYVAYIGGEPVASARASFPPGSLFAGLWTGATLPAHRGKGLYTELVRARAREAAQRGYEYLMVDALPTSQPILTRLGFERLSASYPCCGSPPPT